MYQRPNIDIKESDGRNSDRMNQVGRRFSKVFRVLLNPGYYEGTTFADYFYRFDKNGKSKIYVYDPLEQELEALETLDGNNTKYLVGLTGMGKTTLLRNHYRIQKRDVIIEDGRIVVYISFYNANLSIEKPQGSVEKEVVGYLARTVDKMQNQAIFEDKQKFVEGFYDFLEGNKAPLIAYRSSDTLSDFLAGITGERTKDDKLDKLLRESPIEFYCSLIKYLVSKLKEQGNIIRRIILIYDDIEAKRDIFHKSLIDVANHVHACLSAYDNQDCFVKTIVSLRAYTFRENVGRQSEARRLSILNDTILKKETVDIHEIFERRFREIEEIEEMEKKVSKLSSYQEARKCLEYLIQNMDRIARNMIFDIVNYNLCNLMLLYSSVLTNMTWISCDEQEHRGVFKLDDKHYRLTQETILNAIANGNEKVYINKRNTFIPNLLYNDMEGTDLVGLYIIRYLQNNELFYVYGDKYIVGDDLTERLATLLSGSTGETGRYLIWKRRIEYILEYYYRTGLLLRSLHDIEDAGDSDIERRYNGSFKLYLSPKGVCLYSLFRRNAVLLELYRDDICTELPENDKLTYDMKKMEVFRYLILYVEALFQCEQINIANSVMRLEKYVETFGSDFIICDLLEGIIHNLVAYYREDKEPCIILIEEVRKLYKKIQDYAGVISGKYKINFYMTQSLKSAFMKAEALLCMQDHSEP